MVDTPKKHREGSFEVWRLPDGRIHRKEGPAVLSKSHHEWWYLGKIHREGGPATQWSDGSEAWMIRGKYHRKDGPAFIETEFKVRNWWYFGLRHRSDGPAIERDGEGRPRWYIFGKEMSESEFLQATGPFKVDDFGSGITCYRLKDGTLHREDGPAVISSDGRQQWYKHGKLHRDYGPAVEGRFFEIYFHEGEMHREGAPAWIDRSGAYKAWYDRGRLHREDGPARVYEDHEEYWIFGEQVSEEEYFERMPQKEEHGDVTKYVLKGGYLHREDGPAWISPEKTEWFFRGELHREDGPAHEHKDGTERWYRLGKIHRDDGPAVVYPDGAELWYFEGELHREGGPASTTPKGYAKWSYRGKPHREDGPAIVDTTHGFEAWYIHGNCHREGAPAVITPNTKQWFRNGQRHREDGPAIECADGTQEWWLEGAQLSEVEYKSKMAVLDEELDGSTTWRYNGQLHRLEGPARILEDGTEEWYIDGKLHREDGPAVVSVLAEEWYKHGQRHREDGPAIIEGRHEDWYLNGNLHRDGGPAVTSPKVDAWYQHGVLHREDGPAVIHKHGDAQVVEWYLHGQKLTEDEVWEKILPVQTETSDTLVFTLRGHKHRLDGPAVIGRNPYRREWWVRGVLHRDSGPATCFRAVDSDISIFKWYDHGKLHRIRGPAVESPDGDEYWIDGIQCSSKEEHAQKVSRLTRLVKFAGTEAWVLPNGSYHRLDGPAFTSPETELWYCDSLLHREDGPAVIRKNNPESNEWWIHGRQMTKEEHAYFVGGPLLTSLTKSTALLKTRTIADIICGLLSTENEAFRRLVLVAVPLLALRLADHPDKTFRARVALESAMLKIALDGLRHFQHLLEPTLLESVVEESSKNTSE